jgi:oleate hydratase
MLLKISNLALTKPALLLRFGLQPWHSATEFRRALRQYLGGFHSLSILSCLDITGHYQYESIFLPIFLFLQSLHVDFQFDTKVTGIVTTSDNDIRKVSRLDVIQDGFKRRKDIGPHDVVIATLGSTMSGTAIGSNDEEPVILSHYPNEELDENWSIWLALSSKDKEFGNPYSFCTRRSQSMLESFTITTEELTLFNYLTSVSLSTSTTGALIVLQESQWKLNLCIPAQPVFHDQPPNVRVLWGFALFPECKGNYVKKPMIQCSGAEILAEVLKHVRFPTELLFRHTVTIPRVMPRMSSLLLAHSCDERPAPTLHNTSNIGLVGQFVEIPEYSCLDMSYGVRAAQIAVSQLLDLAVPAVKMRRSQAKVFLRILLWK